MSERRRFGGALGALVLCAAACSTDTSGLARRGPAPLAAGAGGSGAAASGGAGEGGSSAGGAAGEAPEPSGDGALTLVHGLVDGGRLFACWRDRTSGEPIGGDAAQPPEGLAYGGALELSLGWDVAQADVEALLFVAAPSWAGSGCAELEAGAVDAGAGPSVADAAAPDAVAPDAAAPEPPFPLEPETPRRAGAARFAPGALRAGGRYALIAAGCTGPGAEQHADACGEPDPLFGGFRALVVAEVAAQVTAGPETVGLQFVNASRAVERADLALQSERQGPSSPLGSNVPFGAVRPLAAAAVVEPIGVELYVQREGSPSYVQAWADTAGADVLGHNHLLVYLGPSPAARIAGLAPPRFTLVRGH